MNARWEYDYADDYGYEPEKSSEIQEIEKKLDNAAGFFKELYTELTLDKIDLNAVQFYMSEIAGFLDVREEQFGPLTINKFAGV